MKILNSSKKANLLCVGFIALSLALSSGCSTKSTQPSSSKQTTPTAQDNSQAKISVPSTLREGNNFKISIPNSWSQSSSVEQIPPDPNVLESFAYTKPEALEGIYVKVATVENSQISAQDYIAQQFEEIDSPLSSEPSAKMSIIPFKGYSASKITFDFMEYKTCQYVTVIKDGKAFVITFFCPSSTANTDMVLGNEIVNSFEFK